MRCRVVDLAIVVKSEAGNEGKLVTIERFVARREVRIGDGLNGFDGWLVRGECIGHCSYHSPVIDFDNVGVFPDDWLFPIRDKDGEDEMLRIAGKPADAPVKVVA